MTSTLRFVEDEHRYFLNTGTGEREVPSVTKILRAHVKGWQASEWHMTRGSAVHAAVKLALDGRLDETSLDERIVGRVQSILNFIKDANLKPVVTECRLVSKVYQYAGCLDFVGSVDKGEAAGLTLADWKSTFEPSAKIQIGLYENLWRLNDTRPIRRGVIVECKDSGQYKCHWITSRDLKTAAHVGIAMLTVLGWREKNNLLPKEETA